MTFLPRLLPLLPILMASVASAQVVGGMDFKMEKLYEQQKWEDLGDKALRMLENDKYKDDPEILLYASMAFYEISQSNDEKLKADWPKALEEALKYAQKARKKDKEGTWHTDNIEHYENLKKASILKASEFVDDDKKRRNAVTMYKAVTKAIDDDYNLLFFKGVLEYMNRNDAEGERNIKAAMGKLVPLYQNPKYRPSKASAPVLEDGMIRFADILIQKSYVDSARKTIDWGLKFFPNSEPMKAKSEAIQRK